MVSSACCQSFMNSVSPACQELKAVYDNCFLSWFPNQFLKGNTQDSCAPLFTEYQKCVKKAINDLNIQLPDVGDNTFSHLDKEEPSAPAAETS